MHLVRGSTIETCWFLSAIRLFRFPLLVTQALAHVCLQLWSTRFTGFLACSKKKKKRSRFSLTDLRWRCISSSLSSEHKTLHSSQVRFLTLILRCLMLHDLRVCQVANLYKNNTRLSLYSFTYYKKICGIYRSSCKKMKYATFSVQYFPSFRNILSS